MSAVTEMESDGEMSSAPNSMDRSERLAESLRAYVAERIAAFGGPQEARNPGHRINFHWPPHPPSYSYHLVTSDWRGVAVVEIRGESFPVLTAKTNFGVFGKCELLWLEAMGQDEETMLANLREAAEPLFRRQHEIAETLGLEGRFRGHIRDLADEDLLKLFYSRDRDVAHEARTQIELRSGQTDYLRAFIEVLRDDGHPQRRSAQWCVLDLLEDTLSFTEDREQLRETIDAIRNLIWSAPDDYARTIYKAGVVLGGHLPGEDGGPVLLECLSAPSKFGRRSAIHGLFHVAEWQPEMRAEIVAAVQRNASEDSEPILREYSSRMAHDIESAGVDHVADPAFPEESA